MEWWGFEHGENREAEREVMEAAVMGRIETERGERKQSRAKSTRG